MKFICKVYVLFLFIITVGCWFGYSQNGMYTIDSSKSIITFKVSHMGFLKVKGSFSDYSGKLLFQDNQLISAKCSTKVASVDTNNEERDDTIKQEAYFDIVNYPYIEFQADAFFVKDNKRNLKGLLKIKESENTLTFPYDLVYNKTANEVKLIVETEIKRKDFDLDFGSMNGLIGNKVRITLEIIATKQ